MDLDKLKTNKDAWDKAAEYFFAGSSLPSWGPFDICKNTNLIGHIKDKTFLEIGFGSGHSIKYLADRGAKKIYGIDISHTQLQYANKLNKKYIEEGKVNLFETNVEKKIKIPQVDVVFSIYAIGWTVDPQKTLKNIYSYLKPGGKFIWSWEHSFFRDVKDNKDILTVEYSYHDEPEIYIENWVTDNAFAYIKYRKVETWFKLLKDAGFNILNYLEPKPISKKYIRNSSYCTINKAKNIPNAMVWICEKLE